MKLNALTNLEVPGLRAVAAFPAFSQLRYQLTRRGYLGQVISQLAELNVEHVMVKNLTRVQHIAGRATGHALSEATALLRRRHGALHIKARRHRTQTHRRHAGHEFASAHRAFRDSILQTTDLCFLLFVHILHSSRYFEMAPNPFRGRARIIPSLISDKG